MSLFSRKDALTEEAREAITEVVTEAVRKEMSNAASRLKEATSLGDRVQELKKQVADLEIQRDKKKEEFDRREREVEHMVGLERKRQEFETDAAKRGATLDVREANLKADRDRFEKQMEFQNDRFTKEVVYLKELVERTLAAIPGTEAAPKKRGR